MSEQHKGYEVDRCYDWVNHLIKLRRYNPKRFYEFYSDSTIYYYTERLQYEHLTPD